MGKKSTEGLLREIHRDSDYLTAFDRAEVTDLQSHDGLIETLMQQKKPKQKPHTADRLIHLRSLWIEDNTDKYVGEVSLMLILFCFLFCWTVVVMLWLFFYPIVDFAPSGSETAEQRFQMKTQRSCFEKAASLNGFLCS